MQITNLIKIARAQFLLLGLALFLFGALVAVSFGAPFSLARLLLGTLIVELAQLSVHFSNDYFDADSDAQDGRTLISGGAGVLSDHPELRETSRRIALGLILLSLALGVVFVIQYDMPAGRSASRSGISTARISTKPYNMTGNRKTRIPASIVPLRVT